MQLRYENDLGCTAVITKIIHLFYLRVFDPAGAELCNKVYGGEMDARIALKDWFGGWRDEHGDNA